ncbi:hypothetical protein LWI28_020524 [Acer negundo]|uniref:Early flowering 3 n=1 Tax=Acer negundo TaxID=4023 RepID=A0AAD5NJZ9_ACENE|nr:hypothetical protein LWI28_020524 [Acer negundo]
MRGGRDDEKVTTRSPMFPRLHVNDTEKGGPRAPPRNKMALYEQLSIPSQRFTSGSPSLLSLQSNNGSSLAPSMSSSNGGGYERSVFTQFCKSPAPPSILSEKVNLFSSGGMKLNTVMANQEWKSMKPANSQSFNATGPLSPTAKCNSFKPRNFSNFKSFLGKKLGDEDDFRVPSNNQLNRDRKFKLGKGSRLFVRNQIEDNVKVFQPRQDLVERPASITSSRDRNLVDVSSGWPLKVTNLKSLKRTYSSMMNQETRSNVQLNQEFLAARDEIDKENVFKVRTESMSLGDENSSPKNGLENGRECLGDRHDDVSNTGMMDSISVLGLSPDDVVGVIGEKQFWKARRAIIDQQRVFAVQVFELHRLMKVQKLIARSPHLLLDDQLYMSKPHLDMSSVKKLPPKSILEASPQIIVKSKDNSQKPDLRIECEDENAVGNLPLPSINNDTSKGLVTRQSNFGCYSGNAPPTPVTRNIKPSPWCFPPPGNQWLVSVMSPSEGLVYKPYTGPCPPTAGFVAPFYGSCGPVSLTPAGGDFLSTAYGVPASHQQGIGILPGNPPLGQTYFPPYGMPVMNPSISSSAVEQMSPFPGTQTKDNNLSVGDINFIIQNQSSCDMSSQMSLAISCCLGKFQASKESEVQGSTASSPAAERAKGDALPLFPMEPIVQAESADQNAQTNEQQSRVIKVVPHNPRLATESAARIFQSIQEGRKQYD